MQLLLFVLPEIGKRDEVLTNEVLTMNGITKHKFPVLRGNIKTVAQIYFNI